MYDDDTLGDEFPPEQMVAGERRAVGSGRLQGYDYIADGTRRPVSEYRDTELDHDCLFLTAADGSLRCLPGGLSSAFFASNAPTFSDENCSQLAVETDECSDSSSPSRATAPVLRAMRCIDSVDSSFYEDPACTTPVSVAVGEFCGQSAVAEESISGCPGSRFYRVDGPVEGDLFTFGTDGACREITETERPGMVARSRIDIATLEKASVSLAEAGRAWPPGARGDGPPTSRSRALRAR